MTAPLPVAGGQRGSSRRAAHLWRPPLAASAAVEPETCDPRPRARADRRSADSTRGGRRQTPTSPLRWLSNALPGALLLAWAIPAAAAPPCPSVPFEGVCDGAIVSWCEGGSDRSLDCGPLGMCCGWDAAATGAGCVPCGPCADACAEGEVGCSAEGTHAWTCEVGPSGCRTRAWSPCQGSVCTDDACGGVPAGSSDVGCPTSCEVGASGCTDDATAWVCEVPAPGACSRKATTVCLASEACFNGQCHPVAGLQAPEEPAAEGCGAAGGATAALGGLMLLLTALAARSGAR